jgi:hypothetical protein
MEPDLMQARIQATSLTVSISSVAQAIFPRVQITILADTLDTSCSSLILRLT